MLLVNYNIDLEKMPIISKFLKQKSSNHAKKKATTFSNEQITKFITEAPDPENLVYKLACILGLDGGLRNAEIHNLKFKDLTVYDDHINVFISNRKTDKKGEGTYFFSMKRNDELKCPIFLYKKYCSLINSKKEGKLFKQFRKKDGKFVNQVLGINSIAGIPFIIATYLNLPNPETYTGHSLRRTASSTLL